MLTRFAGGLEKCRVAEVKQDGGNYALSFSLMLGEINDPATDSDRLGVLLEQAKALASDMAVDQDLDRSSAAAVAEAIGVIRLNSRSVATVAESIAEYFVWWIYQIEANRMAARATPW